MLRLYVYKIVVFVKMISSTIYHGSRGVLSWTDSHRVDWIWWDLKGGDRQSLGHLTFVLSSVCVYFLGIWWIEITILLKTRFSMLYTQPATSNSNFELRLREPWSWIVKISHVLWNREILWRHAMTITTNGITAAADYYSNSSTNS